MPPSEPRLRDRPSQLCHVELLFQPGPRPDGFVGEQGLLRTNCLSSSQEAGRRSCSAASRKDRCQTDQTFEETSRIPWSAFGRTLQTRALSVLKQKKRREIGRLPCV